MHSDAAAYRAAWPVILKAINQRCDYLLAGENVKALPPFGVSSAEASLLADAGFPNKVAGLEVVVVP